MSWKLTFQIKEGDPVLPVLQQQAMFSAFEKIVSIYDSGRYCFEYGSYILTNETPGEKEIINEYVDFFRNAALSMLNTSILEILKLLAPKKSNDVYSLDRFIQNVKGGTYGKDRGDMVSLDQILSELTTLKPLYDQAKTLRDKVIAHTDPDGIPRFSVKIIETLYEQVLDILIKLMNMLFELQIEKGTYNASCIKNILAGLAIKQ